MKKIIYIFLMISLILLNGCSNYSRAVKNENEELKIKISQLQKDLSDKDSKIAELQNIVEISSEDKNVNVSSSETMADKFPDWLLQDLQIAASVRFPVKASTYGLDWSSRGYASYNKSFEVLTTSKLMWFSGYTGSQNESYYSYYWGPFDMKAFYEKAKNQPESLVDKHMTPIYILESNLGTESLLPAVSIELGNGGFLAFTTDQVITKSSHAGIDTYIVYPVEGIKIPTQ